MSDDVAMRARAAISRGDLVAAYDLACGDDVTAQPAEHAFLAVLAMARMGAIEEAVRLYEVTGLARETDVDSCSLGARLLKDQALVGPRNGQLLSEATQAYARIFDATGDPFPAINAASLSFLSDDLEQAARFARAALAVREVDQPVDYYGAATKAEALVILGLFAEAERAMQSSLSLPGADFGARSTTLRQMRLLATKLGNDGRLSQIIELLRPPAVAFYTGHIFKQDANIEVELAARIDMLIDQERIGFAYGALAGGADILIAERLLLKGAELHVLLPFAESDFITQSVVPAGAEWHTRYERVRSQATNVSLATIAEYVHDPAQFGYGAHVAMGLARLRARHLGSRVVQLALWDGSPGTVAGTGHDVAKWADTGGETFVIEAGEIDRSYAREPQDRSSTNRGLRALLFADFPGFTRIPEMKLPAFWELVMSAAGRLLNQFGASVEFANSWGDALFVVIDSVENAANLALAFQDMLDQVDPSELGLETSAQMRVSVHYGPVYSAADLITGKTNFFGSEVSRAARVEPLTPPGSVYASEPFAAILANTAPDAFATTYVGKLHLPKNFGQYALFSLRRASLN